MATVITDVKVVLTAPEGINLLVVQVETNQPGLVGLGCGTFARHLAVKAARCAPAWRSTATRTGATSPSFATEPRDLYRILLP